MTNMPLDGLAVYPRKAAPEKETPAEEKPKRKRRSRQTDKKE